MSREEQLSQFAAWVRHNTTDLDAPKGKLALTDFPLRCRPLAFLAFGSPGPKFVHDRRG
jgi:hypothetical protein